VKDELRYFVIVQLLKVMPTGRAMLFVPTVKTGKQLQERLGWSGLNSLFSFKMGTANDREMLLARFHRPSRAARQRGNLHECLWNGTGCSRCSAVIHLQHPASVEDYLQEFGRAGRDGRPSVAVLFTGVKDEGLLRSWPKDSRARKH